MADAPTPDELRAIAREARNSSGSSSDDCGPSAYVLAGWNAAIAAQPPAAALTPLTDEQCIEAARKFFSGGGPGSSPELWFLRGLRAGEQAHGITTHKDAP